mmetsp:Transcript_11735/g.35404  ORF Transcript_11735/g.35404 Transcript_11735/m.35404 type:complete len:221 (+) Transcript_11735:279-941(+)
MPAAAAARVAEGRPHIEPVVLLRAPSELVLLMKDGEGGDLLVLPNSPDICAQARFGVAEPGEGVIRLREGVVDPPAALWRRSGVAAPRELPHCLATGLLKLPRVVAAVLTPPKVLPPLPSVAVGAKVLQVERLSNPGFFVSSAVPAVSASCGEATPSLTGSSVFWLSTGSSWSGRSSSAMIARSRFPSVPWSSSGPRRRAVIRTSEKWTSSSPPFTEEEL